MVARRTILTVLVASLLAGVGLVGVSPAASAAQFPGLNGRIALSEGRSGSREILTFDPDGTGSDVTLVPAAGTSNGWPAWSPGGSLLAYERQSQIWVVNADGTNPHQVTTGSGTNITPGWAPDASKIVYSKGGDIYSINPDGTGETKLTGNSQNDIRPQWSPDGDLIAYERYDPGSGTSRIMVINPDGSNQVALTAGGRPELFPSWHPTRQRLLFVRDYGSSQGMKLLTIGEDGKDEKLVAQRQLLAAQYSPNGRKIVGISGTPLNRAIATINSDGSGFKEVRFVSGNQPDYGGPAWRPVPPV